MFCNSCGRENMDGQSFCMYCGEKLDNNISATGDRKDEFGISEQAAPQNVVVEKEKKKTGVIVALILAIIILAAAIGVMTFFFFQVQHGDDSRFSSDKEQSKYSKVVAEEDSDSEDKDSEGKNTEDKNTEDKSAENSDSQDEKSESKVDLTNFDELSDAEQFAVTLEWLDGQNPDYKMIDYNVNPQTPNPRNTSLEWDSTFFYSLEDTKPLDPTDGLINYCNVSRVRLKNKETQNIVECEIYKNSNTNEVEKIVTIEQQESTGLYEVWEYYFQNRLINFIFYSVRDVYTPTYATTDKLGERYYYNNKTLVKFRKVTVPLQPTDFLVSTIADADPTLLSGFNNLEVVGLTRANNVYAAIQDTPIFGNLNGYLYNTDNEPIRGATIRAYNEHYQKEAGTVTTDANGYYSLMVPSDASGEYRLTATADSIEPVEIYGVLVDDATSNVNNENIYMPEGDAQNETVAMEIILCDALNSGGNNGISSMLGLSGASLEIRKGVNNRRGDAQYMLQADANGVVHADLPLGMYTGRILKDGYMDSYFTIAAKEDNKVMQSLTTPVLGANEVRIVLTWGSTPNDLDSHLFTPYQGTAGDMQHIGYYNPYDEYGNNLDVDDTNSYGPETITITDITAGNYKYYVSDYSNLSSGNVASMDMSNSNATVRVYDATGLAATFNVPVGMEGTIWEVFEIRNRKIIPIQRYYSNVDDKSWWGRY